MLESKVNSSHLLEIIGRDGRAMVLSSARDLLLAGGIRSQCRDDLPEREKRFVDVSCFFQHFFLFVLLLRLESCRWASLRLHLALGVTQPFASR